MIESNKIRTVVCLLSLFLPMGVKRTLMNRVLGWRISKSARIGFSFVSVDHLAMGDGVKIGHFNVIHNIDKVSMRNSSKIGNFNWISGIRSKGNNLFPNLTRRPSFAIGQHSSMTSRHLFDCSDAVIIGEFTTIAGARTQIMTHEIDVLKSKQTTGSVQIGNYCYIGTSSVLLKGSKVPDYSILGACSLLNKKFEDSFYLYAGVPARPIKPLDSASLFFHRKAGAVE